jgi:hypothetical protein
MKRALVVSLLALLAAAPGAWAGLFTCCNWGIHCMEPPPPTCDCEDAHGHGHCSAWKSAHAEKLIDQLCHGECCCERIKAAEKLGCCLHADWCCCPDVVSALVNAMQCDTCWEVRRAAARALGFQGARTHYTVLCLYVASKADPHYMVRDGAKEALDILLVCTRDCYQKLFDSVDKEIKKIKPYYKPTTGQCVHLEGDCNGIVVHVCVKKEEKAPAKEECLIPIKIEEHECPAGCCVGGACPVGPAPVPGGVPVLIDSGMPLPGTPLLAPPAGAKPEPIPVPPAPAGKPK